MQCVRPGCRWARLLIVVVFLLDAASIAAFQTAAAAGSIRGTTATQNGTVALGGALVTLLNDQGEVASTASEADGSFTFTAVPAGAYSLVAVFDGFAPQTQPIVIRAGEVASATIDLRIASVSERVDVVASSAILPSTGTLTYTEGLSSKELDQVSGGNGLQSALRMLVSVIQVPGGISIKGGRPNQAAVQLGPGAFVDPATGLSQVALPDDAIDSVTVLPNPYAVEYGRFSSGLILIRTRRAEDEWKTRLNNLEPSFRSKRDQPFSILGLAAFSPRFESGGPLVKDRLFVQQSMQYRYRASDVASRPQSEVRTSHGLSSFTRFDANLSPRHSMIGTVGLFPARSTFTNLGTFTPPEATVDMHGGVNTASVTERSVWSDTLFSETTGEIHGYDTTVTPQGHAPMQLLPETTEGNFFNQQQRTTATYQFIETLSGTKQGRGGLHLFKAGIDLLHSRYRGSSLSNSVLIEGPDPDRTMIRRLDFSPLLTEQAVNSTDVALFAQDRLQPTSRYYLELGARLDRDGVVDRWNLTPRVGAALLLNQAGTSVLRSGYGLFFERTPSVAGVYEQFEAPVDTRYAADGVTPLSSALFRRITDPNLRTSRSLTWDLGFDHKFNPRWAGRIGVIDRRGSRELILEPITTATGPALELNSGGRSAYREAEFGLHYTGDHGIDVNASYVRSRARANLNSFTTFFDSTLWPLVGRDEYAPARTDTPNRVLVRGRVTPTPRWLLVGVFDWRNGMPYSVVNQSLDFFGPRNNRRFPTYVRVDLGIEHRFKIFKAQPWIGVRADNALNSFLPSDVQANITSPAFGTFYNTEYRQFRIQVRFER